MTNPELNELKKLIADFFQVRHGYCGIADGDNHAMLNSGGDEDNFIVTIEDRK